MPRSVFIFGFLAACTPLAAINAQEQRTDEPVAPLAVYLLAVDQSLAHMRPRYARIAVYPPRGILLPPAALGARDITVTDDGMPCSGASVVVLAPARQDSTGLWRVEASERYVDHGMSGGRYTSVRCNAGECTVEHSFPFVDDRIVGCPVQP